ncbi:MAG TPA: ABC transporter permease, partial [Bacteroidales bacterium]|nr:ABC transporter permease [Bacteroidales bacterium]
MLRNYLTTIFRILYRDRLFSLINITGLATGIAACLFISVYVHYERSYDQHIDNVQNLFRVLYERESESGEKVQFASASPMIGAEMKERFPEVLEAGKAYKTEGVISHQNISFREENMFWAEPSFLNLLSFRIIKKNGDSLLSAPNTAVISAETAKKYFGDKDPLNKIITLNGDQDFRIMGVYTPQPANMHFKANILLSWKNWENILGDRIKTFGWIYSGFYNYVRLKDGTSKEEVDQKITNMINDELGAFMEKYKLRISYRLQPVSDIHLTSHYMHELGNNGNKNSIIFLNIIAWFIIVIAWINFVNLLTISFTRRSGEIGLRKVLGGKNRQLIVQFLFESFIINFIALFISFVLIEQLSPWFYRLTGIAPDYIIWNKPWVWFNLGAIFLTGTLLAGLYPVWGLLTKKLSGTLRKTYTGSKKSIALQRGLVVFQFFMAVILIAGTISVYLQIKYLHESETGFKKGNILVMYTPAVGDSLLLKRREAFKEEIKKYPFVKAITYSSVIPGKNNMMNRGGIRRVGEEQTEGKNYRITDTDYDFTLVFSNI